MDLAPMTEPWAKYAGGTPMTDPWAKYLHGKAHVDTFLAELGEYLKLIEEKRGFYWADTVLDEATRRCTAKLRVRGESPFLGWSLLIGDALHNFRSALDHAIEAATIWHTGHALPGTGFPVFDISYRKGRRIGYHDTKRSKLNEPVPRSGLYRVRGVHPNVAAVVEGHQPYHDSALAHRHPLRRLNDFDNMDKHRVIPVFGLVGPVSRFDVRNWTTRNLRLRPIVRFQDGVPLADFELGEGSGILAVDVGIAIEIRFGDGEPGFGEEVLPIVGRVMDTVRRVLMSLHQAMGD